MADLSQEICAPILSASVYCEGHLDDLLHQVLAPFRLRSAGRQSFLWFLRYQRGGEHLKLRLHADMSMREPLKALLEADIQGFLAALPPPGREGERDCRTDQFPVDEEDECTIPHPDRTLLWTRYRWIPRIMGREPMSDDPRHAVFFWRCLGAGSDIVLRDLKPDVERQIQGSLRMSLALKLFVTALASFDQPPEERLEYLRYHRDWLFTSFHIDPANACERFDQKLRRHPEVLEGLRPLLTEGGGAAGDDDLYRQWQVCSRDLYQHLLARVDDSGFLSDPYLKDQVLATPFNLLHTHANQLGIGIVTESYLCQLLLRACESAEIDADEWRFHASTTA